MPASNSLSKKSSARRRQRWRPGRPWLPKVAALTARCCHRWPPATPPTLRAKTPSAPFWSLCAAAPGHAWARSRSSGTSATAAGGWCCKGVWKFCGLFVEVARQQRKRTMATRPLFRCWPAVSCLFRKFTIAWLIVCSYFFLICTICIELWY